MKLKPALCFIAIMFSLLALNAQTSYVREIPIELPIGLSVPIFTLKAVFPSNDKGVVVVGEISALSEDIW